MQGLVPKSLVSGDKNVVPPLGTGRGPFTREFYDLLGEEGRDGGDQRDLLLLQCLKKFLKLKIPTIPRYPIVGYHVLNPVRPDPLLQCRTFSRH